MYVALLTSLINSVSARQDLIKTPDVFLSERSDTTTSSTGWAKKKVSETS